MNLANHISNLLYTYDCVIVPGMGGFVTNYSPATIHPTQHLFTPPSKNIAFNKSLINNDGLLANHISITEQLSFTEANKTIADYSELFNNALKKGEKFHIENVGTLFFDVEKNIQFEPDTTINYLIDSFGLSSFQSPAIKRDYYEKPKPFTDRTLAPQKRKKINLKKYIALAIAAPVLFTMAWIPLRTEVLKNIDYASLNPFYKEAPSYNLRKASPNLQIENESAINENSLSDADSSGLGYFNLTEETGNIIVVRLTDPSVETHTTLVEETKAIESTASNTELNYHIVAGCFRVEENAEKLVEELKSKNLNANIIGKNNAGLTIVSAGSFPSREEAKNKLSSIQGTTPGAWVMKK